MCMDNRSTRLGAADVAEKNETAYDLMLGVKKYAEEAQSAVNKAQEACDEADQSLEELNAAVNDTSEELA